MHSHSPNPYRDFSPLALGFDSGKITPRSCPELLPLTDGRPTPLPYVVRPGNGIYDLLGVALPPGSDPRLELHATRLVLDFFAVTSKSRSLLPSFKKLASFTRCSSDRFPWQWRAEDEFFIYGHTGKGAYIPAMGMRAKLRNDAGRWHAEKALKRLASDIDRLGSPFEWLISRVDVAVDYPVWSWDMLLLADSHCARSAFYNGDTGVSPYFAVGKRPLRTTQYFRFPQGDDVTRVEFQVHQPCDNHGRRLHPHELADLADPTKGKALRPMWAVNGSEWEQLALRLMQVRKLTSKGMPLDRQRYGNTQTGRRKAWKALMQVAWDMDELAKIAQPGWAFGTAWQPLAAEATRVMGWDYLSDAL